MIFLPEPENAVIISDSSVLWYTDSTVQEAAAVV